MPFLVGETISGRYRIIELLAQGRFGATYRAFDERNQRQVAIKELLDPSVDAQRMVRQTARRLARQQAEFRPKLRDHFTIEGVGQFLVNDYIDGVNLQTLIDQYGSLPSDRIVTWLQAISRPLATMHANGELHGDIKPANIIVTPKNELFLVDGGLDWGSGSSGYAPPEQQSTAGLDVRSDIFALGATLFALLTGQTPPDAMRRQSGMAQLPAARDLNPDVEPYLSMAAARALSLNPAARFEDLNQFNKALERPYGGAPQIGEPRRSADPLPPPRVQTVPASRTGRRTVPRKTANAFAVIGSLAVLLAAIGLILLRPDAEPEPTAAAAAGAATATPTLSAQAAVLTDIAPTITPTPSPTPTQTPTPAPFVDENSGAAMIYVPGSSFRMGDDEGDRDTQPSRLVQLDAYFIDQTEVSNLQYSTCVEAGACQPPQMTNATYHPSYYGDPAYDDYPVIFVNWYQANTFCEWRDARLPTEAEWEMAAGFDPRVAQKFAYPWGVAFDPNRVNFCDANCFGEDRDGTVDDGHQDTAPVASYDAGRSQMGMYNMSGNVWEWVFDWYSATYYADSEEINPFGPANGEAKVIRGGSWLSTAEEVSVTYRSRYVPEVVRANIGFRCAMTPP